MSEMPFRVWYGIDTGENVGISAFHTHTAHELLYIVEGEVSMNIAGKRYHLVPGQMAVVSAVEVHDLHPITYPYRRIGIHITSESIQEMTKYTPLTGIVTNHGEGFCHVFDLRKEEESISSLLFGMHREASEGNAFGDVVLRNRFSELLVRLYRAAPMSYSDRRPDPLIDEICRYIDAHFAEEISIEELAKMHFFSIQHFIRRFRGVVGYTPKRYLILRRLAESRVLLSTTDSALAAVAAKSGFADANSFVRCFRKETGITPGGYRKQYLTAARKEARA